MAITDRNIAEHTDRNLAENRVLQLTPPPNVDDMTEPKQLSSAHKNRTTHSHDFSSSSSKRRHKKNVDPAKRRKPNGWALFVQQFQPTSSANRLKEAAAAWKQMTSDQKAQYNHMNSQLNKPTTVRKIQRTPTERTTTNISDDDFTHEFQEHMQQIKQSTSILMEQLEQQKRLLDQARQEF